MAKMLAVVVQRADGTVGVITRHRQHRDVDARELFAERTGALPVMVVARMMQPVAEHAARQPRHHRKIAIRLAAFVPRSEEHTSELQSLMRNSDAVFCLNKKNTHVV